MFSRVSKVSRVRVSVSIGVSVRIRVRFSFIGANLNPKTLGSELLLERPINLTLGLGRCYFRCTDDAVRLIYTLTLNLRTESIAVRGTCHFWYIFNIGTVSFGTLNVNFCTCMFRTRSSCLLLCKCSFCRRYTKHVG